MSASPSTRAPAHGHRPHKTRAIALISAVLGLLSVILPTQAGAAALPPPPPTPVFGRTIEPLAAYVPGTTCDPTPKPGVVAFKDMILKRYGGVDWGISNNNCGVVQEHKEGRAWDWHMSVYSPSDVAKVNSLLNWLFATDQYGNQYAMARRLGIMYIGWNQRLWGSYRPQDGWRLMSDRGSDTQNHKDHVHFSFSWDGARKKTSFWHAPAYSGQPPLPAVLSVYKTTYNTQKGTVEYPYTLVAGRRYLVFAKHAYLYATQGAARFAADPECSQSLTKAWSSLNLVDWLTHSDTYLDLKVNGQSTWMPTISTGGGCNLKDHTYAMVIAPSKTQKLNLRTVDVIRKDNRGSMAVEVRQYQR